MAETSEKNIQNILEKHLLQIKELYRTQPHYLLEHYESERSHIDEYNGRQLFEMIQNADDASYGISNPKAEINLSESTLTIANTGESFSEEGLYSILHSNLSPKYNKKKQIGNKGLGFRAILSWAEIVSIKSGILKIEFSSRNSEEVLKELIYMNSSIEAIIIKRYGKYHPAIAILRCPKLLQSFSCSSAENEFDTIIRIKLKPQIVPYVKEQLKNIIDYELLLFLNNLEKITIITPEYTKKLQKKPVGENKIKISGIDSIGNTFNHTWNINKLTGTREADPAENRDKKNYELCVAWKDNLDNCSNVLYSYFKTNAPFKFPGILHGTFELSSNRDNLIDDPEGHNRFLFKKAASLIADTAELIAQSNVKNVDYKAVSFGNIDFGNLPPVIDNTNFREKLIDELKKKDIFPTIANKYINWEQKPAYYSDPTFAELLDPLEFPNLLINCSMEGETFLESFGTYKYEIERLIKSIAKNRKNYTHYDYSRLIKELYTHAYMSNINELPPLIYDDFYKLLPFSKTIFLLNEGKGCSLPKELGVHFIHYQLANSLKDVFEAESFKRLSIELTALNIKSFCFEEIVKILIEHSPQENNEDVYNLNSNIFSLFKGEVGLANKWKGTSIPLVNAKNKIDIAQNLHLGKEYNCHINEVLFAYDRNRLVEARKYYNISDVDHASWEKYLLWAGVNDLPKKIQTKGPREYAECVMKNFDFSEPLDNRRFKNFSNFKDNLNSYEEITVYNVDDIDNILPEFCTKSYNVNTYFDDFVFVVPR